MDLLLAQDWFQVTFLDSAANCVDEQGLSKVFPRTFAYVNCVTCNFEIKILHFKEVQVFGSVPYHILLEPGMFTSSLWFVRLVRGQLTNRYIKCEYCEGYVSSRRTAVRNRN